MASLFTDILAKGARSGHSPRDAASWYRKQAKTVSKGDTAGIMKNKNRMRTAIRPGSMYMYFYDPKHKKTLPFYDMFPLIFVVAKTKGGFYGLNLHYLPPRLRARLMDALYELSTDTRLNENTRLKLSYDILKAASKFKLFKPCFKKYLTKHLRSRFFYVFPAEWDIAMMLPTAKWHGVSSSTAAFNYYKDRI